MVPSSQRSTGPVVAQPVRPGVGGHVPGAPRLALVGRNGHELLAVQDALGHGVEQRPVGVAAVEPGREQQEPTRARPRPARPPRASRACRRAPSRSGTGAPARSRPHRCERQRRMVAVGACFDGPTWNPQRIVPDRSGQSAGEERDPLGVGPVRWRRRSDRVASTLIPVTSHRMSPSAPSIRSRVHRTLWMHSSQHQKTARTSPLGELNHARVAELEAAELLARGRSGPTSPPRPPARSGPRRGSQESPSIRARWAQRPGLSSRR